MNARIVGPSGSRTYDGTTSAAASILTLSNVLSGDTVTLSGSATLAAANAGPEAISSVTGLSLGGTSAANYTLVGTTGSVTINARSLTIVLAGTRIYDGTNIAASSVLTISSSNAISGDALALIRRGSIESRYTSQTCAP